MNESQKEKRRLRSSKAWRTLRHNKNVEQGGVDPITGGKLTKLANLHHMDLRAENYSKIDNPENFVMLNKQTHETIHILYKWYVRDRKVIGRIVDILDRMVELNK